MHLPFYLVFGRRCELISTGRELYYADIFLLLLPSLIGHGVCQQALGAS